MTFFFILNNFTDYFKHLEPTKQNIIFKKQYFYTTRLLNKTYCGKQDPFAQGSFVPTEFFAHKAYFKIIY